MDKSSILVYTSHKNPTAVDALVGFGYEYGYGYDCGLWRDAPLESVQWPPPAFLQLILPGSQCQIIHVGCSNTEYWLVVRLKRKCFREHEQDAW